MRQKTFRLPSPGTVLALIALAVMAAPIALADDGPPVAKQSATKKKKKKATVPARAKYADKAGSATRLGGYKASFSPAPNTIPVLNANGKLAASVLPTTAATGGGGTAGAAGQSVQGPAGPAGPAGASGFNGMRFVFETGTNAADTNLPATKQARCNPNERVTGGGFEVVRPPDKANKYSIDEVKTSKPVVNEDGTTGWLVQMVNVPPAVKFATTTPVPNPDAPEMMIFKVWAVCVIVDP